MQNCGITPGIIKDLKIFPFSCSNDLLNSIEFKGGILVAVNAEKILHATDQTRDIINRNIGYCDGIGAVWALKSKGYNNVIKLPGCELWLKIISKFYKEKTFYFVGGKQNIIDETILRLRSEFEGINILNYRNGYINSNDEKDLLLKDIVEKRPDIIFVAMGSPKQELLMEEMMRLHPAIYQGLGGSFDVYTGNVKRATEWWVRNNLEWAYRLLKQPTRIKRQICLMNFLILLLLKKI